MTYFVKTTEKVDKIFAKISKKDQKQIKIIRKKIFEIVENPSHYKNLRSPMQHLRRVHIDSHFVLVFSVDDAGKTVTLEDYAHHDEVYL